MSEQDRETIKEKIARLMAMGNDSRTNKFEAEAALRQAMKLMRIHSIEQAELADATKGPPQWDWDTANIPPDPHGFTKSRIGWFGTLAVGVAKFTDVKVSWRALPSHGQCVRIDGDYSDVQFAAWLLKNLRDHVRFDSDEFMGSRADREQFRVSMVQRLSERMRELRAAQTAEMQQSESRALVWVNTKVVARDDEFGAPNYTRRRVRSTGSYGAREAGRDAGDKVGFNKPIGGEGGSALALGQE